MADMIQTVGPTGQTLYAVITNSVGQYYNPALNGGVGGFEAGVATNWTTYAIPLTEQIAGSGKFAGIVPPGISSTGNIGVDLRRRGGAAPAVGDTNVGGRDVAWTGTAEASAAAIQTRITLALPTAAPATVGGLPVSPNVANAVLMDTANTTVSGTITKAKLDKLELAERSGHYKVQYGVPDATHNTIDAFDPSDTGLTTSLMTVVVTIDSQGRPTQAVRTIH